MNLYNLHTNPEQLVGYDEQYKLPGRVWNMWLNSHQNEDTADQEFLWPWLLKDPESSYRYAEWVGGRVPDVEESILWDAKWARIYAIKILKHRWLEAEEMIMTDRIEEMIYAEEFGLNNAYE